MAACMLHLCLFFFWMKIGYHFWGRRALSPAGISCRTSGEGWLSNCCFPQQQNGAELLLWEAGTPSAQLLLSLELSRRKGWATLLLTEAALSFLDAVSLLVPAEVLIELSHSYCLSQLHDLPLCWAGSAHGVQSLSKGQKTCSSVVEETAPVSGRVGASEVAETPLLQQTPSISVQGFNNTVSEMEWKSFREE